MKITRRQLRTLIESVINEQEAPNEEEQAQSALLDYLRSGRTKKMSEIYKNAATAAVGTGFMGGVLAAGVAPTLALALPVIAAGGIAAYGLASILVKGDELSTTTFENQIMRRAGSQMGFDVNDKEAGRPLLMRTPGDASRVRSPRLDSGDLIDKKTGKIDSRAVIRPNTVEPEFARALALLHSLMDPGERAGLDPKLMDIVDTYADLIGKGVIDGKAFNELAKEESKKIDTE